MSAFLNLIAIYGNMEFNPTQEDIDAARAADPSLMKVEATPNQLKGSVYGAERDDLQYNKQVLADILVSVLIAIFLIYAVNKEKKIVERIDEAQQTNQDYTIGTIRHYVSFLRLKHVLNVLVVLRIDVIYIFFFFFSFRSRQAPT